MFYAKQTHIIDKLDPVIKGLTEESNQIYHIIISMQKTKKIYLCTHRQYILYIHTNSNVH